MNIYDIARLAGVSRKTVQRALSDSPSVKPETKNKIRLVMEQHHYEPNAFARTLSSRQTDIIGIFIVQDARSYKLYADDLFYGAVVGGIVNQCSANGFKTMITILDISDTEPLFRMYKQKSIDAGIIVSWSNVQAIVDRAAAAGFRIGVFDQNNVPHPPAGLVIPYLDNRVSAYRAGAYLLDLGHTELGIITGSMDIACAAERLQGFLQAAGDRGVSVADFHIYEGHFTENDGAAAIDHWMENGRLPSALFCSNDLMAYGALQSLTKHGVSVPDDISVIGFDDLLISRYMHPALTSLRVPRVEMAEAMTAQLIDDIRIGHGSTLSARQQTVFEAELMVRSSCRPAMFA